jgi:tetratricopeptide (TPR) repeat protein
MGRSSHYRIACGICALALLLTGCQAAAPIHVWSPPLIESAVGRRVAIAPIGGDPKIAVPLHAAMLRERPRERGREVYAIDATLLESNQQIRLASATTGETSDIALVNLARRSGVDFILQGEVIPPQDVLHRSRPLPESLAPVKPGGRDALSAAQQQELEEDEDSLLRVSWNLIDVSGSTPLSGQPVVTRRALAEPTSGMLTSAAQAAWELVIPHVIQDQAELAAPRLARGAQEVRRGNEAAAHGNWQQAEQIWEEVLRQRPRQHAAMHNLAVAAVARQDYIAARRMIAQALRSSSSPLYQTTAVWIEQRQRDYHVAFGLPDPPEGWAATSR